MTPEPDRSQSDQALVERRPDSSDDPSQAPVAEPTPPAAATADPSSTADGGPDDRTARPLESALTVLQQTLECRLEELAGRLDRRFDGLQSQFDREVRAEATRERVVDRLHTELQGYKQDLLYSLLRPLFLDLIQWHDELARRAESLAAGSDPDQRQGRLLAELSEGLEDLLCRHGVEPFRLESDQFDPSQQRSIKTVTSPDPCQHRTVAARLRPGFRSGERLIRPELVSVYTPVRPPAD